MATQDAIQQSAEAYRGSGLTEVGPAEWAGDEVAMQFRVHGKPRIGMTERAERQWTREAAAAKLGVEIPDGVDVVSVDVVVVGEEVDGHEQYQTLLKLVLGLFAGTTGMLALAVTWSDFVEFVAAARRRFHPHLSPGALLTLSMLQVASIGRTKNTRDRAAEFDRSNGTLPVEPVQGAWMRDASEYLQTEQLSAKGRYFAWLIHHLKRREFYVVVSDCHDRDRSEWEQAPTPRRLLKGQAFDDQVIRICRERLARSLSSGSRDATEPLVAPLSVLPGVVIAGRPVPDTIEIETLPAGQPVRLRPLRQIR